jgi:hypothetical protein
VPRIHTCAIERSDSVASSISSNRRSPNVPRSHALVARNPGTPGWEQAGGPDVYLLLVGDREWSPDRYQGWLATQLIQGLLR